MRKNIVFFANQKKKDCGKLKGGGMCTQDTVVQILFWRSKKILNYPKKNKKNTQIR